MPRRSLVCLLALALAGCLDLDHDYTLNPDGSGKVTVRWSAPPMNFRLGNSGPDPEEILKEAVRQELSESKGVDAWKDVSYKIRDDGKISFQGTAYFKELGALHLHNNGFEMTDSLSFSKDAAGALGVELKMKAGEEAAPPDPLSDEEIEGRMKSQRAEYRQMKPLLTTFLGEFTYKLILRVPGKVGTASVFRKASDRSVEFGLEGRKLMEVMDRLMMDDAWVKETVLRGADLRDGPPGGDARVIEELFGGKGPIRVVTEGDLKPQFDYAAETAAAREETAALLKDLQGAVPVLLPAAKGEGFKSVTVAGVSLVHVTDPQRGIHTLNAGEPGLTLALLGELPGKVLAVQEGEVLKAVADNGESLLPKEEWSRKVSFPRLSGDGTAVSFEVKLQPPGRKVAGLREVSGTLQYTVAGGTEEVDLGIATFRKGEKGGKLGAKLGEIGLHDFQEGHQKLELTLAVASDAVESVEFFDEAGRKLAVEGNGWMGGGGSTTFYYAIKGKFPEKGRIVAKAYADLKAYEIPFSVRDIDLLGRPLK